LVKNGFATPAVSPSTKAETYSIFYCISPNNLFSLFQAIQIHERTQKHKKNKERETKFQMRKMHNREKTEEEKYEEEVKYLNDVFSFFTHFFLKFKEKSKKIYRSSSR